MAKKIFVFILSSVIAGFFGYHLYSFIKHWHPLLFLVAVLCGAAICGLMLGIVMRVIFTRIESTSRLMYFIGGGVLGSYILFITADPLLSWGLLLCSAVICGLMLGIATRVILKLGKHRQQGENENA